MTLTNCATAGAKTFTVADQQTAWEKYIQQDKYLSSRRGKYAERNAVFLPILFRSDRAVTQELFHNVAGQRNTVSVRFDILNLDNLLNSSGGRDSAIMSTAPLCRRERMRTARCSIGLRNIGTDLL